MATLQDHARLVAFVDGDYLVEITSIEATWNSGQQRVDLLNEGLGGFTPGSGDVTISLGFAIPIGGLEYPFVNKCQEGAYVSLQLPVGRQDYVGTGKIMTVSISQSVNGSTEGTMEWTGEYLGLS